MLFKHTCCFPFQLNIVCNNTSFVHKMPYLEKMCLLPLTNMLRKKHRHWKWKCKLFTKIKKYFPSHFTKNLSLHFKISLKDIKGTFELHYTWWCMTYTLCNNFAISGWERKTMHTLVNWGFANFWVCTY